MKIPLFHVITWCRRSTYLATDEVLIKEQLSPLLSGTGLCSWGISCTVKPLAVASVATSLLIGM